MCIHIYTCIFIFQYDPYVLYTLKKVSKWLSNHKDAMFPKPKEILESRFEQTEEHNREVEDVPKPLRAHEES